MDMMKRETADDMLVVVGGAAAAANVSGGSGGVNDADATFTRQLCVYALLFTKILGSSLFLLLFSSLVLPLLNYQNRPQH